MEGSSGPGDLPPEYLAQASSMSPTFVDPQTAQQQFDWSAYGPGQAVYTTAANAVSPYLTAGPFGSSNPAPQGPGGPYPFGLLPPPLVSPGSVAEASSSWPPHDSSSGPPILEPATPFGLNPNDDSNLSRKGSLAESVQSSSRAGPSTSAAKTTRSCDSCSLRRVRCIRLDPSLGTESECKKCKDKGILCTTNRVVGRRKQQRSGKRIEEARRTFGRIKADGTVQLAERVDRPSDDLGDAVFGDLSQASTDDRLAVASLSSALTMGLLDAYFDIAHLQLPKSFHRRLRYVNPRRGEFNPLESARDRQREDMMEVLQAVVIAFGARASDSPAILGNDAPKIQELKQRGAIGGGIGIVDASTVKVEPDAATGEPEFDPTEWGRRREEVCRTLLERALRLCDEKGAMRIATVESVVALMMLEILIDHGDPTARRGRPLSLAAIGHVRTLMDDADPDMLSMMGPPSAAPIGSPTSCSSDEDVAGSSEASRSQRQQVDREKEHDMQNLLIGGGGGWAAFVRDGFIAAGTGRALHTTDEDIELFTARYWSQRGVPSRTLEEVVERMDEVDSVEGAKEAEWLIWERVNRLARAHVKRISGPTPRSRPLLDLDFVCEFWAGLDGVAAALDTAERHLDAAVGANMALSTQEPFLRGNFRLAYLGLCYLVFACDRTLAIRRTDLERDAADHGLDPGRRAYAEQLVAAKQQSEGRCFKAAIRIVGIMHKSLERAPTVGIVTGVHFMYQWLPSCVFYIVGTDEEGQGGPEGYTRSVKLGEIRKLIEIFRSLAWSWSDIVPTIKNLETALKHFDFYPRPAIKYPVDEPLSMASDSERSSSYPAVSAVTSSLGSDSNRDSSPSSGSFFAALNDVRQTGSHGSTRPPSANSLSQAPPAPPASISELSANLLHMSPTFSAMASPNQIFENPFAAASLGQTTAPTGDFVAPFSWTSAPASVFNSFDLWSQMDESLMARSGERPT